MILLLRHGRTAWNAEGRMQGRLDVPLDAHGEAQARAQGAVLRREGLAHLPATCSPQRRARDTARLAGLSPALDPDLSELDMGDWQGRLSAEVARDPHGVTWKLHAPNGEGEAAFLARLARVEARLAPPVIVVTHGVVLIGLLARLTGRGLDAWDGIDDPQGVVIRVAGGVADVLR